MKLPRHSNRRDSGSTLIEAVLAIGVLAVAIPLAFGAMAEAGKNGAAAVAETRSTWIIDACMEEFRAIRSGRSTRFTPIPAGHAFPPAGELLALGFSTGGNPVAAISKPQYDQGIRVTDGRPVRYIATLHASDPDVANGSQLLDLRITIEYPASAPAGKRRIIDFHSRIP